MPKYLPGWHLHPIQARLVDATPWGWRPARILALDGQVVTAAYVSEHGTVTFWHHRDLRKELHIGQLVRVHERFHVLATDDAWLNVRIDAGMGPVPDPPGSSLLDAGPPGAVVNMATGRGIRISPEPD
jgi:hypothetical protein